MSVRPKALEIRTSPHIFSGRRVDQIMRNVVGALLPVVAFAVYAFGLAAVWIIIVATLSCVLSELLLCRLTGRESSVSDWSAVITGLLFGLTLPPGLPLWMAAAGGFLCIAVGKFLFGGLGQNVFNPALVGRALLQAAFPVSMTTWSPAFLPDRFYALPLSSTPLPFMKPAVDAVTAATPLGALKFEHQLTRTAELVFGMTSGSVGETSGLVILIGGLYLALRKMLNWRIPVAIFMAVSLLSGLFHWLDPQRYAGPLFMLFSGGLMLGAVFMATDMVASPLTSRGVVAYGAVIGVLVVIIRYWGGLPEGVMYAILIGNACSPLIERLIQPKVYGTARAGARHAGS